MSTTIPPPAVGTPSHEWANETAQAAAGTTIPEAGKSSFTAPDPSAQVPGTSSFTTPSAPTSVAPAPPTPGTGLSTPGPDIPGAYPFGQGERKAGLNDPNQVVEKAKSAVPSQEDVKQYLPSQEQVNETLKSAQETAATTAQTLAETAKQYLPASVASYLPGSNQTTTTGGAYDSTHTTALPSTELTGTLPGEHVGGAGALPGTINETGVAKVLDERTPGEKGNTLEGMTATGKQGVASAVGVAGSATEAAANAAKSARESAANAIGSAQQTASSAVGSAQQTAASAVGSTQETAASAANTVRGTTGLGSSASRDDINEKVATAGGIALGGAYGAGEVIAPSGQPQPPSSGLAGASEQPNATGSTQPSQSVFNNTLETSSPAGAVVGAGTSLPSGEREGAREGESTGGVGALPGAVGESGIAQVPERQVGSGTGTAAPSETGLAATVGAGAAEFERKQSVPRAKPEDMVGKGHGEGEKRLETDPLVKTNGKDAAKSGATKMPEERKTGGEGMTSEAREAVRNQEVSASRGSHSAEREGKERGEEVSGKVENEGKIEGKDGEEKPFPPQAPLNTTGRVHALGPEGATLDDKPMFSGGVDDVERGYEGGGGENADADDAKPTGSGKGDEGDYHPAKLHPPAEGGKAASAGESQAPAQPQKAEGRDAHSARDDEGKHKASFMDKVKGEAKVLTGKLTGKKEKVEEGERVKSGGMKPYGSAVKEAVNADGKAA
ncbi:hypothetical protein OE88DRAFT_1726482 [Heliocybe sulcata]|uniref:Uncharacterized protein n=1 Tax=Heliocybe sulcata TaxID=5364 RepID=A0A5C3NA09_9AGAM|nr:hypothetical protein OE88DRAFT_1726482 [Heliocybe sulcata]